MHIYIYCYRNFIMKNKDIIKKIFKSNDEGIRNKINSFIRNGTIPNYYVTAVEGNHKRSLSFIDDEKVYNCIYNVIVLSIFLEDIKDVKAIFNFKFDSYEKIEKKLMLLNTDNNDITFFISSLKALNLKEEKLQVPVDSVYILSNFGLNNDTFINYLYQQRFCNSNTFL